MAAYLLAVAILFCIQGWPSGTVQGQVTPFLKVYERSACQTRETVVPILEEYPHEVSHIFRPPCVAVLRCGGCCGDESLKCTATGKRSVGLEIMRVDPRGTSKMEVMQFMEHTACECSPRSASGVNSKKRKRNSEEGEPRAKFPFV